MKRFLASLLALVMLLAMLPAATASSEAWDGESSEAYAGGTGTQDDPYLISNGAQLYQLVLDASDSTCVDGYFMATKGLCYKLTQDINMGDKAFRGIACFSGTLDGAGYAITNLKIANTSNPNTGLIQQGYYCTVRNLTVSGTVTGARHTGGIVGYLDNTSVIENCVNRCSVAGTQKVGGICGYGTNAKIQNCHNYGTVYGSSNSVGGICGYAYTAMKIQGCSNMGAVSSAKSYVGGICGYGCIEMGKPRVAITQCANGGAVNGDNHTGGILGYAHCYTNVENCYNCGSITSAQNVGGIIGCAEKDNTYSDDGVMVCSGYNKVKQVYNCGILSGETKYDPVNENPSSGYVYYYAGINEDAFHPATAVGLTAEAMTLAESFAGFDFANVWTWDSTGVYSYPILRNLGVVLVACEDGTHLWNEGVVLRPASCTEAGEQMTTCTICAASRTQEIPALGHDIQTGTDVVPTCTEDGLKAEEKCSRCDYFVPQEVVPALGHDLITAEAVPASCTEDGLTEGCHCTRCDYAVAQEAVPALGHDMLADAAVPVTCTEDGLTEGSHCSRCDYAVAQELIPATGHSYTSETSEPDCTEQGCTTYTCSVCGDTYADSYVDALGHTWDEGVRTLEPTCAEEGNVRYTCLTCGGTKDEAIAALGHSYQSTATEPNCTEAGYTTYVCAVCADTYTEITAAALGHTWDEGVVLAEAGCVVNGKLRRTCTVCAVVQEEVIPAKGHDCVSTVTKPTCTETGYTTHVCSICGESYRDTYVGATGHAWNGGIDVIKATCTEPGERVFTCGNCGLTRAQEIAALGHSHEALVTVPTCTEGGFTTYTCAACGDSYVADTVEASGHDYEALVTAPTCTEEGFTTYTCAACGDSYVTDTVEASGHDYEAEVTAPTCTEEGFTTYTCAACGDSYVTDTVEASGHDYEAEVTAPTCTEEGFTTYTCSACGDSYVTDTVEASGHSYEAEVTAPTCTEEGFTTYTCSACGDSYVTDTVEASGHDYEALVTAPTCTEEGFTTYTCAACGDSYVTDTVEASGHDYEAEVTAPTCTEDGFTTYTCSVCGNVDISDVVTASGHSFAEGFCGECGAEDPDYLPENPFEDVREGDYFYTPVLWAVHKGITNGVSPTIFAPDTPCTRGQIVTFLWRACGSPEPAQSDNPFEDVEESQYYYKAVLWAVENGITTGLSETSFAPHDTCTRGQVATFLWRAQGMPAPEGEVNPFTDVTESDYYYEAVLWAVENEVTQGVSEGIFAPGDSCTRGQIVTFLYRALAE